ncbi:hypothetical protein EJB05_09717, partial [Eragrostis curvula]
MADCTDVGLYEDGARVLEHKVWLSRVDRNMDSGNSSCSRTRSGLVRRKSFTDGSDDAFSRTRSGLVRRKSFMDSSGASSSRTGSELVRRKSLMAYSDGSCSRTRSGLVRQKSFIKSSECSRTRSGLVRGRPSVKALIMDGPDRKELPDADGDLIEETPSKTRSGLVRQSSTARNLSKDEPIIKGLADGWLKEDKPLGTRSGLALTKVESTTKGQRDEWPKEDNPDETRNGLFRGSHTAKARNKDESVTEGLPDGWWKEYRPRPGSALKSDPYYIDPVSGYEFRSMKDVYRYLRTGDIRQCIMRPKKGTLYDVCITENQTQTSSSSQQTRPGTADKGIQCEILTSEGIMLSWDWEELFTPCREKNTEHTMLPESESMKAMEGCVNELETLQQNGGQPFSADHAPRQTDSVTKTDQNVEVNSKKRKISSVATPPRVSPCLAALNAQTEAIIEPEDQPVSINRVNKVQTVEENNSDQSETSQSSTMTKINGHEERTFNQSWSSQEDTVNRMQAMQENTTNHSQPSQADTVNHIQMNQENTGHLLQLSIADADIPTLTVPGHATDQPNQAGIMNHKQTDRENTVTQLQANLANTVNHTETNQKNTAHELQSSLGSTVIPIRTMQEYTMDQLSQADTIKHIQMNEESTANQLQSSLADTVIPICGTQEFASDHSQPSMVGSMNQIQASQANTTDELQLGQADTVAQIQMMQGNMTHPSQLNQVNTLDQLHINLENTNNHLEPDYAENPLLQTGFSWASQENGGALVTDFWRNVENQHSSVSMQIDGVPVASFPANVQFQNAAAAAEPVVPTTQAAVPVMTSDQSGLVIPSLFGNAWSDPCIEFAFKTLTGDIPVLDDTAAVTDYYPQQQDLNKGTGPNCSASALDNSGTHTQVDVNLPLPRPSDKLYNGSWFPPQ